MAFSRNDTKVVKGFAIVLMLYHHLFYFPDRIASSIEYTSLFMLKETSLAYLIGQFGKICVSIFLFLGGYGTYLSFCKYGNDNKSGARIISTKIKKLYTEYWKVFIIFIPICILAGVERVEPDLYTLLRNFSGLSISYCGEWWFFTPYVALLFTYPIGHKLVDKKNIVFHDAFFLLLINLFVRYILPNIYTYTWASQLKNSFFWSIFSQLLLYVPTFYMGCIFAKHNLLSLIKQRFSHGLQNIIIAIAVLAAVVYLRYKKGAVYDYLFAPVIVATASIIFNCPLFKYLRIVLEKIGQESTVIWLVHSIYCYLLCQKFIFLPRYTFLIFLWLLLISFATSVAIRKISDTCASLRKNINEKKKRKPPYNVNKSVKNGQ